MPRGRTAQDVLQEKLSKGWTLERVRTFALARDDQDLLCRVAAESGRACNACRHWHTDTHKEPCASCEAQGNFEEQEMAGEKPGKKKTGKRKSKAGNKPRKAAAASTVPGAATRPTPDNPVTPVNLIPLDRIQPSPLNRQVAPDSEPLRQLALSMQEQGLQQPIVVRPLAPYATEDPEAEEYELVVGERRWRAARRLGWERIEAIVRLIDADEAHAARLVENLQREDVPPLEQSEGVSYLLERHGRDAREVARRLGVSETWVHVRVRLADLSPAWRAELARVDTEHPHVRDHVTFQEEVAKLPPPTQDRLLRNGRLLHAYTLAGLRERIGESLRRVADAPWPAEREKRLPKRDRCENCARRSDAAGNRPLFAELVDDAAAAVCLDPDCWARKEVAWIEAEIKRARKRDAGARVLVDGPVGHSEFARLEAAYGEVVPPWRCTLAEDLADADGEPEGHEKRLAVFVAGPRRGETVEAWFEVPMEEGDEAGAAGEPGQPGAAAPTKSACGAGAPACESDENAELARAMFVREQICSYLVDTDGDEAAVVAPPPEDARLLRLASVFGTECCENLAEAMRVSHEDFVVCLWPQVVGQVTTDLEMPYRARDLATARDALEFAEFILGPKLRQAIEGALSAFDAQRAREDENG